MLNIVGYLALGLLAGTASGMLGIGGGIVIVPILVYFYGLTQHQAQGTTLALMLPPIGLLAALKYWREGWVDLKIAGFGCLGFILGGFLGANIAAAIPDLPLKRIFGVVLLGVSIRMIWGK